VIETGVCRNVEVKVKRLNELRPNTAL